MVWIFQEGHLASVLGITPAPLNLSMVVLLCSIAFSLSVDYEIFLLSRIKEARDSGLSNNAATVVRTPGRVRRIVTSAALLLTITLISFANGLAFMKMFGIGTALAVVIDDDHSGVVVPAFLRVAGDLNWWAPRPLRWLHSRIGISEAPSDDAKPLRQCHTHLKRCRTKLRSKWPTKKRWFATCRSGREARSRSSLAGISWPMSTARLSLWPERDRAPLSQQSVAAQQLAALAEMVRTPTREG